MATLGLSKALKAVVVILALLVLSLAPMALAKEGRGKGGNRGSDSQRQQADRSSARNKTPSSSHSPAVMRKEPQRAVSSPSRPSTSERIQRTPQISQRITTSTRVNTPVISKPQVQINKPSISSRINSPSPRINVTKPSKETGQSRAFRISKVPSGVEVRRPGNVNVSGQQVIKPNVSVTTKPKPVISTRINKPVIREIGTRVETKPLVREKPQSDRAERIATRIELPQADSRPAREQGRNNERTVNDGRTSHVASPHEKPTISQQPRRNAGNESPSRPITDRSGQSRASGKPRWFGRGRQDGGSKPSGNLANNRRDFTRSSRRTVAIGSGDHDFRRFRPASTTRVSFEDRTGTFGHKHHRSFVFRDQHHLLVNRIIWPSYHYPVYYRWGGHYSFHYVYPFYQRRYIFVSLGGFWPDYSCIRYYWYPVHSFFWYGYSPLAYEVPGDTYNYYTYNYYTGQPASTAVYSTEETGLTPVDSSTFADVREKLNQQQGPDAQTVADTLFDEGITAFGQGGYAEAADKFAAAMALAPDDEILPFAYAQALFADGRYSQAADALRTALQKATPEKEGVYYPRGLYLDENNLDEQIDRLAQEALSRPDDSDLQLLLGYNLLGAGETEQSIEPLTKAKDDYKNFGAASVLLDLAEKIKTGETQ